MRNILSRSDHPSSSSNPLTSLQNHLVSGQSLYLVANIGIWYNLPSQYRQDLSLFLEWLSTIANSPTKNNQLFFLETYPSHWNTPSGYYPQHSRGNKNNSSEDEYFLQALHPSGGAPSAAVTSAEVALLLNEGRCCYPIQNLSHVLNWRNSILYELISRSPSAISIIPAYDLLTNLHNMHKCDIRLPSQKWDCTHYCYSPTMFQYLWEVFQITATTNCFGNRCQIHR
jgi:hypothetical protein